MNCDTRGKYPTKRKGKKSNVISTPELSGEYCCSVLIQNLENRFRAYVILLDFPWNDYSVDNVLYIDTTFNVCSSCVTDCCYSNYRLTINEGKHQIFLGPETVHFEIEAFLLSRFASEMLTHRPAISNLKTIGTDLEKAIFNDFLSQIKNLKLLLCVFYLQQNDKRKLMEIKAKGQSQAKNTVLSDICDRQYSIMKENVLANSKDANELAKRLE